MTKQETHALILRMYAALNTGNIDDADNIFTQDFYCHPLNGGIDVIKKAWSMKLQHSPNAQVVVEDMIVDGNKIASFTRMEGVSKTTTGNPPKFMEFIYIKDGRIAEIWGLTDMSH